MIPCQKQCPHYQEGCHKTCASWKDYQAKSRIERQKKRFYLQYYNQLCQTIIRQCRQSAQRG